MVGGRNLSIIFVVYLMFALSVVSVSLQPSNHGKIAFSSDRDGNSGHQIFVMNPDGSNQVKLTNAPCTSAFPTWSSDGTRIAFTSACGILQAYIIDADSNLRWGELYACFFYSS